MVLESSEIMRAFYIDEIETIMKNNSIEKITNISTSGVAPHFRDIIDNLSDEEVMNLEIPTGVPLVYELDDNLNPIKHYYLKDEDYA